MITVDHLTKRFADVVAVDDISFHVEQGEVVGFLGPNGAGKTTTMRIITGFLRATAGSVTVAGCDVATQSLEARRHIGYLPENVPLYPEMRIREYLNFRGKLKGLARRQRRGRAVEVMELCGVADVSRTVIGHLSKGYRQRVGLADALLADPEILILDEPTLGLDPNQIRQVRELIKNLARGHTVILSTHILPEVEMTCGRVIIIDRGRIAASDSTEALVRGQGQPATVVVVVGGPGEAVKRSLEAMEGVRRVTWQQGVARPLSAGQPGPPGRSLPSESPAGSQDKRRFDEVQEFHVEAEPGRDLREEVSRRVVRGGWTLLELRERRRTLEEIFVEITASE